MRRAIINPQKCNGCSVCQVAVKCDQDVIIREAKEDLPWIDFYYCRGCMKCLKYCAFSAVEELIQPCNMQHRTTW